MPSNSLLVVMPLYNAEDTIAKSIESILSQTHKNLNLIIVDDNSTDDSLKIAKEYLADKRVSIYKNKINMGAYYSRNFGLWAGKDLDWAYFTTHDADDISFAHRYKKLIKKLRDNSLANGIQDTFDRIDMDTGRTVKSSMTMAHAVFKREVFDKIGYFDSVRFGADWEHWFRINTLNHRLENGKLLNEKEVLGESYIHDSNLTVQIPENSKRRRDYIQRATKKINRRADLYYDFVPEKGYTRKVSK